MNLYAYFVWFCGCIVGILCHFACFCSDLMWFCVILCDFVVILFGVGIFVIICELVRYLVILCDVARFQMIVSFGVILSWLCCAFVWFCVILFDFVWYLVCVICLILCYFVWFWVILFDFVSTLRLFFYGALFCDIVSSRVIWLWLCCDFVCFSAISFDFACFSAVSLDFVGILCYFVLSRVIFIADSYVTQSSRQYVAYWFAVMDIFIRLMYRLWFSTTTCHTSRSFLREEYEIS